jgi:hypothetical protein
MTEPLLAFSKVGAENFSFILLFIKKVTDVYFDTIKID